MPTPHLISHHLCPYVQRAVIVLIEKDVVHKRTYIDLNKKPDWFGRISPLGRVPVLRVGDEIIFESQVIAEYLDEVTQGSLLPADPLERARHRSWIEYGSQTLSAIGAFYNAVDADEFEVRGRALAEKISRVGKEVSEPFFSGSEFGLVDGVWGTVFRYLDVFEQIGGFRLAKPPDRIEAWKRAVMNRPSVISAVPEGYAERLMVFLRHRKTHISSLIATVEH